MNRTQVEIIERAALAKLKEIEEQFGVKITCKKGTYNVNECSLTFSFAETSSDGIALTREFVALQKLYPHMAGKQFIHPTMGLIELTGWNHNAPKYPLLYRQVHTNKTYRSTRSALNVLRPVEEAA